MTLWCNIVHSQTYKIEYETDISNVLTHTTMSINTTTDSTYLLTINNIKIHVKYYDYNNGYYIYKPLKSNIVKYIKSMADFKKLSIGYYMVKNNPFFFILKKRDYYRYMSIIFKLPYDTFTYNNDNTYYHDDTAHIYIIKQYENFSYFEQILFDNNIVFTHDGKYTIITKDNNNVDLHNRLYSIPKYVIFENNGYVDVSLNGLSEIDSVQFNNNGYVDISINDIDNYNGTIFNNNGIVKK